MIELCNDLMNRNDWVVLDTETTGLDSRAEAVQIGILAADGSVLMDQLVKPVIPLTAKLTAIHGISNEMIDDAPTFWDILPELNLMLQDKKVVVYNAPYDRRILEQSYNPYVKNGIGSRLADNFARIIEADNWIDVMGPYAEYWGDWSDWHGSFRWQKLTNAVRQQGITVKNAHRAIGDCKMTLALIRELGNGKR